MALVIAINLSIGAVAASDTALQSAYSSAAEYCAKTSDKPVYGGEWITIGLCRGGAELTGTWGKTYYISVADTVKACGGVLNSRKYTEYSRVILGLTAAGFDAANVDGYDLTLPLGDYDMTVLQGINGPVWALIALDSRRYEIPKSTASKTQATREMYVKYILSHELSGGGWAFSGSTADPDMTAMALCALSKYKATDGVSEAVERAVVLLSSLQNSDGGYSSGGTANSESCAQVIVALGELGISLDDELFIKSGNSPVDKLLTYQLSDGSFEHIKGGGANGTATEQGLLALASAKRAADGNVSLYRMVTFSDIQGSENQNKIEVLANAGLVSGMGNGLFAPDKTMTRAEFCAIVVKALGLGQKTAAAFSDVPESAWYSGYIGAAYESGIVKGSSATTFTPNGTITDVEAGIMLSRAAVVLGLRDKAEKGWYASNIKITRCEVASQVYDLLNEAGRI